jgi:hypothetical protein
MLWILEAIPSRGFYERLSGQLLDERQMSGAGAPEVAYGWPTIGSLCEVATARPRASHEGSKAGLG